MRLPRMTMRRWMVTVAVVALLIVIVPHVIRELRRRYIIGFGGSAVPSLVQSLAKRAKCFSISLTVSSSE